MAEKTYPDYGEMERHWNDKVDEIHLAPMPPTVAEPTTKDELVRDLLAMGVRGRHALVHSSYKLLAPVENGPQAVVNACLEAVGPDGCLMFPTYDFESFTERGYWDHANTPSRMGIITGGMPTARAAARNTAMSRHRWRRAAGAAPPGARNRPARPACTPRRPVRWPGRRGAR